MELFKDRLIQVRNDIITGCGYLLTLLLMMAVIIGLIFLVDKIPVLETILVISVVIIIAVPLLAAIGVFIFWLFIEPFKKKERKTE